MALAAGTRIGPYEIVSAIAVYDVGRAESTADVVTELLEGHTLRAAIAEGPLPVRKVLQYATQVAAGLAATHEMTEETSALSPDGTRLVFAATATDATRRTGLWLRTLASGALEAIDGTDDARNPFWSPDGTEVGYFAGGRLRAIDLERRRVRVIAEAPGVRTSTAPARRCPLRRARSTRRSRVSRPTAGGWRTYPASWPQATQRRSSSRRFPMAEAGPGPEPA